jgi:hypothetical protein
LQEVYIIHNPKGFYEDKRIVELNDEILHRAGGNWLEPPSEEKILEQAIHFSDKIKHLIQRKSEGIWGTLGLKDPRLTLTASIWHPHLENPQYVACFRNPNDIAKSLSERNQISVSKALSCSMEYNFRLIKFLSDKQLKYDNY